MKRSEYEDYVKLRSTNGLDTNYCVIALNEEAGEVAGWYKKFVLRGNPTEKLTLDDLKGELGDTLYYLTALALNNNWTLDDIMEFNKAKLDDRVAKKMRSIA